MLFRIMMAAALTVPMFAFDDDDDDRRRRSRDDRRWERDNRGRGPWSRDDDRYNNRRNNGRYGNGRYGNDRYGYGNDRYGYGNDRYEYGNDRYGYGARNGSYGGSSIINRTLQNVRSAASRNRVDGHERDHFNRAMSELQNLQYNSRNGGLDGGRLDRVLEDLDHLSRADQVNPRDRQMLARDRQALQSLRYGNYSSNRW